jgi:hypothetical protein
LLLSPALNGFVEVSIFVEPDVELDAVAHITTRKLLFHSSY